MPGRLSVNDNLAVKRECGGVEEGLPSAISLFERIAPHSKSMEGQRRLERLLPAPSKQKLSRVKAYIFPKPPTKTPVLTN